MRSKFCSCQILRTPWKLLEAFDYLVLPSCGPIVSLLQAATCFSFLTFAEEVKIMIFNSFYPIHWSKFSTEIDCFPVSELARKNYKVGMLGNKEQGRGDRKI